VRCTARSKSTGQQSQRPAILGGNVCYHHGGNAPQTKAKARRRLEQAADALVARLLSFALDGDTSDNVALCKNAAIRGSNVCGYHGGNAPAVKAKARSRLEMPSDRLARQLQNMTTDPSVADPVKPGCER
jgi:hypothetical protein